MRIVYRNQGNGWGTVEMAGETSKVRNGEEVLVDISAKAKAMGYQGVSWGASGSRLWVGFTF